MVLVETGCGIGKGLNHIIGQIEGSQGIGIDVGNRAIKGTYYHNYVKFIKGDSLRQLRLL